MKQTCRAILFDLDGTLLGLDIAQFFPPYFRAAARRFADRLEPAAFIRELLRATEAMIEDGHPDRTNAEVFWAHFLPAVGMPEEEVRERFERFYREDFPRLSRFARRQPEAARAVRLARRIASRVALATNPVFPREAVEERLRWAGLEPESFDLITSFEVMHFCKPSPDYYLEVSAMLGVEPAECRMVGNDPVEDGAATLVGMEMFLVTDWLVPRRSAYRPAWRGSLHSLVQLLEREVSARG